jgi:flagellar hook protein FlgE
MSLINSLFAGVSGIRNHQSMMDVIGNNIANVNTIGYKGSRVTFSDTFNQFIRYGTNPTESDGGSNTFQIGLGMKLNSIDKNWNQGTFESTGITTDLALQGDGLFVLKKNGETFYSRAGAFTFDANGQLVNSANGAIVQGKVATEEGEIPPGNNAENIIIDSSLRLPAVPTTDIVWDGNLDSKSSLTRSEEFSQTGNVDNGVAVGDTQTSEAKVYDDQGNEYSLQTTYTKTSANHYNLTYELLDSDGNPTSPAVGPTTVPVVFDATSGEMTSLNGGAPDVIPIIQSSLGIKFDLDVSSVKEGETKTLSSVVDGNRNPTIVSGTVPVFDSLGNAHTMTLTFTKIDDNSWKWVTDVPSSSGTLSGNEGTISFNSDGSILSVSPNPAVVTFAPAGGASEENINLDLGESFGGITQISGNSVVSYASQNGSASASLANVSIDQYGFIEGVFTNGQSRKLAQILVATFANNSALTSVGDNMFTVSANTGKAYISEPGEASNTTIQSGALEQSNVDLSEEFTRMIVAQRGFQANSRVITVSDTLLQEITNLVR